MFQLVYEGPQNSEADTVRKIKSALLSKLNFSVDEIREIIEKTPSTIVTADDESALEEYYEELKSAGARVYIVKEKKNIEFELSLDDEEAPEPRVFSISEDIEDLPVYEVSEEEEIEPAVLNKAIEIKEDESLEELLQVLGEEALDEEILKENLQEESSFEDAFSFGEPPAQVDKAENKPEIKEEKKLKPIDFSFDDEEPKNQEEQKAEKIEETPEPTKEESWDLSVDGEESIVPDVHITKGSSSPTGDEVDLESMLEEVQAIAPKVEETPIVKPIEKIEKPVEKPTVIKHEPKESHVGFLLVVLALVSGLWAANHFYFMAKEKEPPVVAEAPKPAKKPERPIRPESRDLKGVLVVDGGTVTINLSEEKGRIKRLALVFRGDESPKLTPEEIVRRVPRAPWIESVIFETTQFTFEPGGATVSNGPVRISVQDDKQMRRLIGTGTMNISIKDDVADMSFFSAYQTSSRVTGVRKENGTLGVSVVFQAKVELK